MTVPVKTHDPDNLLLICLKRIEEEGSEGGSDCESRRRSLLILLRALSVYNPSVRWKTT